MKLLNVDQIKLLRLLADAYNFANYADCSLYSNERYIDKGNYISINNINNLDYKLVSTVCNPLSKAMASIIGQDVYNEWLNYSNHNVDELINYCYESVKLEKELATCFAD